MSESIVFKTIEECEVRLISRSTLSEQDDRLGDWMPCLAARVSYGRESKTGKDPQADMKLLQYLADHRHTSPFEYQHAVVMIECPLFVRSQIMRHRTFSYNEISRRYTSENIGFWIPSVLRAQDHVNKQGSRECVGVDSSPLLDEYRQHCIDAYALYRAMLDAGVAREQARSVLPQSLLTRFYMGGVLRNWAHFLELRLDRHAQAETRVIAGKIAGILRAIWPSSLGVLLGEHRQKEASGSGIER